MTQRDALATVSGVIRTGAASPRRLAAAVSVAGDDERDDHVVAARLSLADDVTLSIGYQLVVRRNGLASHR